MSYTEALTYYLGAFVDELTRSGVRDVVISPGSRSTPLAMLMAEHEEMNTYLHVDERSAAFFALGMAKAKRKPVAVLCTSGTAAANYFPAVCEAFHSRIPVLVLTADRPHELRDVGAPQAMDQMRLFGSFVKEFMEMALPEANEHMYRYVRASAVRAVAAMCGAAQGPVHMNLPLREPLIPNLALPSIWSHGKRETSHEHATVQMGRAHLFHDYAATLSERLFSMKKGVIVCGDIDEPMLADAIVSFAEVYGYPVLADPLSPLRSGAHSKKTVIECYDTFLRNEQLKASWKPDVIIRFGAMPVSKALTQYMQHQKAALHIVVDAGGGWRDPALVAAEVVFADEAAFCRQLAALAPDKREETKWLRAWQHMNQFTKQKLHAMEAYEEPFEGRVITELAHLLPDGSALFVGNSMPIRDVDTFFFATDKDITVMANRGVNGIDGLISTALGVSVSYEPLVLVLGDLSFYHDLNGLLAAKLHKLNATIVVVNNDGGGIFSFLPQYAEKKHFEYLFGTPLGLDYEHVVAMYGGTFSRPSTWEEFQRDANAGIHGSGLHVIEVCTERESNLRLHRSLWQTVSDSIQAELQGEEQ